MTNPPCKCCGKPVVLISAELAHCLNPDCPLEKITLGTEQLAVLTEADIIQYAMIRIRILRTDLEHANACKPPTRLFG